MTDVIKIAGLLNGPTEERTYEAAVAGVPLTAENVRFFIAKNEAETRSLKARRSIARIAQRGNCTEEARALWAAYAAALE